MKVYSVSDVARICNVSLTTVIAWFDKGLLKGHRTPGNLERRIPQEHLIEFMKEHNLTIPAELEECFH